MSAPHSIACNPSFPGLVTFCKLSAHNKCCLCDHWHLSKQPISCAKCACFGNSPLDLSKNNSESGLLKIWNESIPWQICYHFREKKNKNIKDCLSFCNYVVLNFLVLKYLFWSRRAYVTSSHWDSLQSLENIAIEQYFSNSYSQTMTSHNSRTRNHEVWGWTRGTLEISVFNKFSINSIAP